MTRIARIGFVILASVIVAVAASVAPPLSSGTPGSTEGLSETATAQARAVASLRRERAELREKLRVFGLRLDATRLRLSVMSYELGQARAAYDRMYAEFAAGLASMYKQTDRFVMTEIVTQLGLESALPEYDFFSRLAGEQKTALEELVAQRARIEVLQADIAELKSLRLQEASNLRRRLEAIDESLRWGVADLKEARERLAEADPGPSATAGAPRVPQPGIGGLFVGANHPPAEYRPSGYAFSGLASWYGPGFQGNHTANGEIYNMYAFTCASRTLPFNTWLRLTYRGQAVFVRVNDRGPMSPDRVLDLSYAAATALGFSGVAQIEAEVWAP